MGGKLTQRDSDCSQQHSSAWQESESSSASWLRSYSMETYRRGKNWSTQHGTDSSPQGNSLAKFFYWSKTKFAYLAIDILQLMFKSLVEVKRFIYIISNTSFKKSLQNRNHYSRLEHIDIQHYVAPQNFMVRICQAFKKSLATCLRIGVCPLELL